MTSVQFQTDNQRGMEGQNYLRDILISWGQKVEEAPNSYFADWDLKTNNRTIEVKTDFLAPKTGNVCLELEALEHSKADVLAIVTDNFKTIYFKELPEVREFARQWQPKKKGGEFGGELALVPRSIFINRLKPQTLTTPQ